MVIRLLTLAPAAFTPHETLPVLISVKRLSRSQGHSAAGRIKSVKNSNDTIGNRTRLVAQYPNQPHSPCSMELVVIRSGLPLALTSISVHFNILLVFLINAAMRAPNFP